MLLYCPLKLATPLHWQSSGECRKDEVRSLVKVSALCCVSFSILTLMAGWQSDRNGIQPVKNLFH